MSMTSGISLPLQGATLAPRDGINIEDILEQFNIYENDEEEAEHRDLENGADDDSLSESADQGILLSNAENPKENKNKTNKKDKKNNDRLPPEDLDHIKKELKGRRKHIGLAVLCAKLLKYLQKKKLEFKNSGRLANFEKTVEHVVYGHPCKQRGITGIHCSVPNDGIVRTKVTGGPNDSLPKGIYSNKLQ